MPKLTKYNLTYHSKEWLFQKYISEKLSLRIIAQSVSVDWSTIRRWLLFYKIPVRKRGEHLWGKKNYFWKGGRLKDRYGYIFVYQPNHPFCCANGHIKQHRLVVEKYLGRYLTKQEIIHHINEVKTDNRIKNLYLFPTQQLHAQYHYKALRGLAPKYLISNLE